MGLSFIRILRLCYFAAQTMSFLSLEHALNYIVQKVSWAAYQHHVVPKRGKVRYIFLNKTKKGTAIRPMAL